MSASGQAPITPERIMQIAWGYAPPLIIEAAVRHGVFDLLAKGPKNLDEVVAHTGASQRGLRVILNALTGLKLLSKDGKGNYALAPESAAFLVSGQPGYLGGFIRHTSSQLIPHWLKLTDAVKDGKPPTGGVNQEKVGTEFFHEFVEDIFPLSYMAAKTLAGALGIAKASAPVKVLDLAAGSGVWGIVLAQQSPQVAVTALDWPGMLDVTRRTAVRNGVERQFAFVGGDLSSADFGTGYQVATLGHILHSEGEPRSRALLKKTFAALAPGGTIAIQEFLVEDDRSGPPVGLLFAVNMLIATESGDTFSFNEIAGWLREAGFVNARTLDAPGPSPLILADRP